MLVHETAVITVTASTELVIVRLVGLERLAVRRPAPLIAITKDTALEESVFATHNTLDETAQSNDALMTVQELVPVLTSPVFVKLDGLEKIAL